MGQSKLADLSEFSQDELYSNLSIVCSEKGITLRALTIYWQMLETTSIIIHLLYDKTAEAYHKNGEYTTNMGSYVIEMS